MISAVMETTRIRLHRSGRTLTAIALAEPCLALIRNDTICNLLLAEQAVEHGDVLGLNTVMWFSARQQSSRMRELTHVTLGRQADGCWCARDDTTHKIIRRPSRLPYHVVFIDPEERTRLRAAFTAGDAGTVFSAAQQHFGRLPGFDFGSDVLISPNNYATVTDLPEHDYLPE